MSIDQADLLAATRTELRDDDSTTWSDTQLEAAMDQAVAEYSRQHPAHATLTATITTTNRQFDVSDFAFDEGDYEVTIEALEWPVNEYPPEFVRFQQWGASVILQTDRELAAETVRAYYRFAHVNDSGWTQIPASHANMLATGSAGYALQQLVRDDATALTLQPRAAERLASLAAEKLAAFRAAIANTAPRQGQLFRPADQFTSRDTVAWPQ